MMKYGLLALCVLLATSCVHSKSAKRESAVGIPDKSIGLSKVHITEVSDPLPFRFVDSEPGDVPLPERPYGGAPPVISHTLVGMLPITHARNECIECHAVEEKEPEEPTPIPASHYVDLRNAPDIKRDTVAGARYNCISCHALQTDAKPLVQNSFSR